MLVRINDIHFDLDDMWTVSALKVAFLRVREDVRSVWPEQSEDARTLAAAQIMKAWIDQEVAKQITHQEDGK